MSGQKWVWACWFKKGAELVVTWVVLQYDNRNLVKWFSVVEIIRNATCKQVRKWSWSKVGANFELSEITDSTQLQAKFVEELEQSEICCCMIRARFESWVEFEQRRFEWSIAKFDWWVEIERSLIRKAWVCTCMYWTWSLGGSPSLSLSLTFPQRSASPPVSTSHLTVGWLWFVALPPISSNRKSVCDD